MQLVLPPSELQGFTKGDPVTLTAQLERSTARPRGRIGAPADMGGAGGNPGGPITR